MTENPNHAARGPVRLTRCPSCDRWFAAARQRCDADPAHELVVEAVHGTGTVFSYTVTHQAMHPTFADRVPYTTALVALPEGPRLLALVDGDGTGELRIGDKVTLGAADPTDSADGGVADPPPSAAIIATPVPRSGR